MDARRVSRVISSNSAAAPEARLWGAPAFTSERSEGRRLVAAIIGALALAAAPASLRAQTPAPASSPAPAPAQVAPAPAAAPTIKVVPYGVVYFNLFSNDGATNNGDVPMWALGGPGNVSASGRQSRFGLRVTGATMGRAKASAVVEADFFGGFPAVGIGDTMGVLRLRLANARLDWTRASLIVGQDWMVFAPANPVSLSAAGIPLLAATGNVWSRLPQIRGEWKSPSIQLQGAVLAPATGDFSAAFFYQPGTGALSQQPFVQGRAAFTAASLAGVKKPATIGVSGHYGRSRVLTPIDRTVDSRGVAADWSLPLGPKVMLSGEAFAGRNLAGFQAGIFQGINPEAAIFGGTGTGTGTGLVLDGPRAIRTRGGWVQAVVPVTATVSANGGFGLDDPRDEDFVTLVKREARLRNAAVTAGFQHKAASYLTWGLEYRHITTSLLVAGRKTDNHVNLAVMFGF
jgi:hypothetical protein